MKIKDMLPSFLTASNNQTVGSHGAGSPLWMRAFLPHVKTEPIILYEENALTLSSVYRCVKIIADTIAHLPLHVKLHGENKKDDYRYLLLKMRPNPQMGKFTLFQTALTHMLLWGNAYLEISRDMISGTVHALRVIHPSYVNLRKNENGDYFYRVAINQRVTDLPEERIVHLKNIGFDGLIGESTIAMHRKTLSLTAEMERFGQEFFESSASEAGFLVHPNTLSKDVIERIKETFNASDKKRRSVRMLEEGMKFERNSIPPEDAQFLESRVFQLAEVARIFGIPLILLFEQTKNTSWGSGIEQTMIAFVQFTLQPLISHIEEELNYKLFTDEEQKKELHVKFSIDGLLRGDTAARTALYQTLYNVGAISPNEIRGYEDMPPFEGGNAYRAPLNTESIGGKND